jgi:hypothetical protein
MEILNFITANQNLIIAIVLCFTYLANLYIQYKAKANPEHDKWDDWAPTSQTVTSMVHQGVEWIGKYKAQTGDVKLQEYLKQLNKFDAEFKKDKIRAIQELAAWYLSAKLKANPTQLTQDTKAQE